MSEGVGGGQTLGEEDEPWVRVRRAKKRARGGALWARKADLDEEENLCEGQTWVRGANLSDGDEPKLGG